MNQTKGINITTDRVQETIKFGRLLGSRLKKGDIVCLYGELGSGKTQVAKGIASGLGILEKQVNSPSFVLLKQFHSRLTLNHFDLYRLKNLKEILSIGFEEYVYSDAITVIEWAERLTKYLPDEFLGIKLIIMGENKRGLSLFAKGSRYQKLAGELKSEYSLS